MSVSSQAVDREAEFGVDRRASFTLFIVILLALAVPKLWLSASTQLPGIDGGYYTDVAQHVRDGQGLLTNISLYHQGYESFPHPTAVSPLWPLLYGYVARVFPILEVGVWLPTCFYFLSLLFAYLFAARLIPKACFPKRFPALLPAHILVLLIGLHREFFQFTSLPYTEGLAYTLLFAGLWRSASCFARRTPLAGLELGLWVALMMLARGQMMIVAFALYPALVFGLFTGKDRLKRFWFLTASLLAPLALLEWHHAYVSSFMVDKSFAAVFRFDRARANHLLSDFDPILHVNGLWAYLVDRASGFLVAFDPRSSQGYFQSFGLFAYALLLGLVAGTLRLVRLFRSRAAGLSQLRSPSADRFVFLSLLALAGFFSIHTIHKTYYVEWNFARRQALTVGLLMFAAWVALLCDRNLLVRAAGILLLVASTVLGYVRLIELADRQSELHRVQAREYNPQLIKWINERRAARDQLTIALTAQEPQKIAYRTPGVGYHWIYWNTRPDDLTVLVEKLGVDYVIVSKSAEAWAFCREGSKFGVHFRQVGRKLPDFQIFAPREDSESPINETKSFRTRKNKQDR